MAKNVLREIRREISAPVVTGWVASVVGRLLPLQYPVVKVAMLSVARVLP
jgi:hypothetical protein